jgi:LysR family transcriptional activator of nhaA
MSNPFNYKHLYYFWVVAKEGGMSKAADRLDMAVQTGERPGARAGTRLGL